MVDDATGTFYQMGTGYKYISFNGDFLLDESTGQFYDFSMQPCEGPQADFELPAGTTWNPVTLKAEDDKGRYYDTGSGWLIDPTSSFHYQPGTGYRFVQHEGGNYLVDEEKNDWYDFSMQPVEAPYNIKDANVQANQ